MFYKYLLTSLFYSTHQFLYSTVSSVKSKRYMFERPNMSTNLYTITKASACAVTMASETEQDAVSVGQLVPTTKRKLQKHLRSAGLAYVSRTGKVIPAKQVAEELCQCPQKCNERVSFLHRSNLFKYFYYFLGDTDAQNCFLRAHMDVRARPQATQDVPRLPGTRPPRRITCKYLIPLLDDAETHPPSLQGDRTNTLEICQKAFCNAFVISTKRVRLQREKLIHSMGLNSYHHQRNQKRTNLEEPMKMMASVLREHVAGEMEMEVRPVDLDHLGERPETRTMEMLSSNSEPDAKRKCLVDDPMIPMGISVPEGVTIAPVIASPDQDRDIAIVNNFFYHQLWKPEYIGAYS